MGSNCVGCTGHKVRVIRFALKPSFSPAAKARSPWTIKHLNNSYTYSYIIPPTYCPSLFCLFYSYINYIFYLFKKKRKKKKKKIFFDGIRNCAEQCKHARTTPHRTVPYRTQYNSSSVNTVLISETASRTIRKLSVRTTSGMLSIMGRA